MNSKTLLRLFLIFIVAIVSITSCVTLTQGFKLKSIPAQTVAEGEKLEFSLSPYVVTSMEGAQVTFEILEGVGEIENSLYTYSPDYEAAGQHSVHIRASKDTDSATTVFEITVYDSNRAPNISLEDRQIEYTDRLDIELLDFSSDPDGDALTFSLVSGVGQIAGSLYSYSPGEEALGEHEVSLRASDTKGASDTSTFTITVYDSNTAPTISVPDWEMNEGETLSLDLLDYAQDEEGGELSFQLLSGVGQVNNSLYTYSADYSSAGEYENTVAVIDSRGASSTDTFTLKVNNTNRPPSTPSSPQPANGQTEVSTATAVSWSCVDPDGDPLTFEVYFGTNPTPPLAEAGVTSDSYSPGPLESDTLYHWRVVASDGEDTLAGPVWSFRTLIPPVVLAITSTDELEVSPSVEIDGVQYSIPVLYTFPKGEEVEVQVPQRQEFDAKPIVPGTDVVLEFSGWNDGESSPVRTLLLEESLELGVTFQASYYLNICTSLPDYGSLPHTGWHEAGTNLTIVAPEVEGFKFNHWELNEDDKYSVARITTVQVNGPMNLVAYYTHNCP